MSEYQTSGLANASDSDSAGTDPVPPIGTNTQSDLTRALKKILNKQALLRKYCDYYDGKHRPNYQSDKFSTMFAKQLKTFRDNLCKTVVKAPADRLEVVGFATDKNSDAYKQTWEIWKYSQMPRLAKRTHRDAFKFGDAYVIVYNDENDNARIYPQDSRNCCVFYDPESGKISLGVKAWRGDDKYIYVTMYYPNRTEKFRSNNPQSEGNFPVKADAYSRRNVDGEEYILTNEIGTPAMFHFGLECSILEDVIPLNDALNKEIGDLLIGSEANSIRQRWSTGITFEIDDESGKQIIPFERSAQYVATSQTDGKFGEFRDTSLKDFLEVINDFRSEIANVSGIPEYYFRLDKAQFPSGEALSKAEARFVSIVKDAQLDFGETWAEVMRFAMQADNVAGAEKEGFVETTWTPADQMSENERLDIAIKKETVGVSQERNLSELGYSDADIAKMKRENDAVAKKKADQFKQTFDAGASLAGGQ